MHVFLQSLYLANLTHACDRLSVERWKSCKTRLDSFCPQGIGILVRERDMNQIIRQINVKSQLWERLQRRTLSNEHERRSDLEGKVRENFLEEAVPELRSKGWVTLSRQRGTGKDTLPSLISSSRFVSWRNCVRRNLFPWGWGSSFHLGWILPESLLWV